LSFERSFPASASITEHPVEASTGISSNRAAWRTAVPGSVASPARESDERAGIGEQVSGVNLKCNMGGLWICANTINSAAELIVAIDQGDWPTEKVVYAEVRTGWRWG
jgi:hypothetical protein